MNVTIKQPDGTATSFECAEDTYILDGAEEAGVDPKMMKATRAKNDEVREVRDWEQMKGRAVS